ncbi:MAG TPA: hypothetical protein VGU03_00845 [Frateuria sp.]|uniref:hypothetical protein n=1 Tax=Frateuria sp. TaxID=2211372 RepID=UPI002DE998B2|nr:hypothetical protein [Frateuria sp.]
MLGETVAALGGVKSAIEIVKTILQAKSESDRLSAIGELQAALIEIQQQAMALQATVAELQDKEAGLRRENEALRQRASDLSRYQLLQFPETGAIAYELKDELRTQGEVRHFLCANCYQKGEKAILQQHERSLVCQSCTNRIYTKKMPPLRISSPDF